MTGWSLRSRLGWKLGSSLGLLWLAGTALAMAGAWHQTTNVLDSSLQEAAERLLPLALETIDNRKKGVGAPAGEIGYQPANSNHEDIFYQVRDNEGNILLRSHDAPRQLLNRTLEPGFASANGLRLFTEKAIGQELYIQVAEDLNNRKSAFLETTTAFLAPLVILIPLAWIIVVLTLERLGKPLEDLGKELHVRGGNNLSAIDGTALPIEIQPIVQDINRLLDRLAQALNTAHSFAANSSHELRTPLAAALAQAQLIGQDLTSLGQDLTSLRARVRVNKLIVALGRLNGIVGKLLQLARTGSGATLNSFPVNVVRVVEFIVAEFRRREGLADRFHIEKSDRTEIVVQADLDALGIAIANLIENALAHGQPDGLVVIRIGPDASISVVSEGDVVSSDVLERLPAPFVRGISSSDGSGLGLSIVKSIMTGMGGALQLFSPARCHTGGFEAALVWKSQLGE
jgi:two-component system, OmpR family, sensor kinase